MKSCLRFYRIEQTAKFVLSILIILLSFLLLPFFSQVICLFSFSKWPVVSVQLLKCLLYPFYL